MDVYVDGSQLSPTATVDECCQKLQPLVPLMRNLNKHRKCPKWSWMKCSNSLSLYDYCNKMREALRRNEVSASSRHLVENLVRMLSTSFIVCEKKGGTLDCASHAVALAYRIGTPSSEIIQECADNREAVQVSEVRHLEDAVVCRVLYCNHPDVPEYQRRTGYVVAEYVKHSTFPHDFDRTHDSLILKTKGTPSQFLPKYQYGTPDYGRLIREVMLCAMKDGRYSEGRLDGFCCCCRDEVGASEGRMTTGVYLDFHSGNVHIYPKEPGS